MPRLSDDEKIAALEQKLSANSAAQAKLKRELRAVRSRSKRQAEKRRAHIAIVVGLPVIEHALRYPGETRRLVIRSLERYLEQRKSDDPAVADMLDRLRAATGAENLASDAPIENMAESISDAAE